jgi:hypothetical protein
MTTRYVVVDHGLDTGIYKIHMQQTARLLNEFGKENIEIFDSLEDAKSAALVIVDRLDDRQRHNQWQFSFRSDPRVAGLKASLSELTEADVETFFV